MSTHHYFTPPSPVYPYLSQLVGQQCNSVWVHPSAYPQHRNVLKHFLDIQYKCGEEACSNLQPQLCQHVIISPHQSQITLIWVNLASSVTVQGCPHPICLSIAYEHAQTLSIYTKWMWRRNKRSCTALTA